MNRFNTIIVGQGLAGSLLAWTLENHGQKVLIVDNNHSNAASSIAAGIINPITGKRLVLHPSTDHYLQFSKSCYRQLETIFKAPFYNEIPAIRIFQSAIELQQFKKRQSDRKYTSYINRFFSIPEQTAINGPLGGFYQSQTAYLDIKLLLEKLKDFFVDRDCYETVDLDYSHIKIGNESVQYKSHYSDQLIFCEGYQIQNNPWFSGLPLVPTKGEILSLKSDNFVSSELINAGNWLLPTNNGIFKFGATFQPHCTDTTISNDNRSLLLEKLSSMIDPRNKFMVTAHQAGIRPCTTDRIPLVGLHPHNPRLGVFNGFGSKGAMTIPYFAQQFSHYMTSKGTTTLEGDISRFNYDRASNVFS